MGGGGKVIVGSTATGLNHSTASESRQAKEDEKQSSN